MKVIALDQATHNTGYAIYDNRELVESGVFTIKNGEEIERIHKIRLWFDELLEKWGPDYVGFEELAGAADKNYVTSRTLARLQGVLMEEAFSHNVRIILSNPGTWRSTCGVKGRVRAEQKANMIAIVKKWYNKDVTDDEADAIGIGYHLVQKCLPYENKNWE